MGSMRTLLALSVVCAHAPPYYFESVLGDSAVPLFYVISGYLIAYILRDGSYYSRARDFWLNRVLRLYPLYYVVFFFLLLASFWGPEDLQYFWQLPSVAKALIGVVNLTIIGQDWLYFLMVQGQRLTTLPNNFDVSNLALWRFVLNQPSWTLGIELSFYLIAPFVLRRPAWMFVLLVGSWLSRAAAWRLTGFAPDYRFFPFELSNFLLGSLSYRYFSPFCRHLLAKRSGLIQLDVVVTIIIILVFSSGFLISERDIWSCNLQKAIFDNTGFDARRLIGAICLSAALPFMFAFQRRFPA